MSNKSHHSTALLVSIRMEEYKSIRSEINVKQQSLNTILGLTFAVLAAFVTAAASLAGKPIAVFWIVGLVIPSLSLTMLFLVFIESDIIAMMGFRIKEIEDAVNELIDEPNLLDFENATRRKYNRYGRYNFLPKYPIYYAIFLMISCFSSLFALVFAFNEKFDLLRLIPILLLLATIISGWSIIELSRRKFDRYGRW
ncbi:hypothetical protein IQ232_13590 [Microcystis aeruginosa LEGE 11464]|uniref:hypothetical protein n=1 Tax=Microcystis aeruginosa TaxID=1126 RepID=UPI00187E8A3B|nr:hypothetical protein [Microcystis aeruginosa]MBE9090769.1 hypothetical protein [Microcystis aeruginosa LEGE 11464]MDB9414206.1 hypothetical protein [Microcystis aeruginosa CS-567/02]